MSDPEIPDGTLLSPIGTEALPQERVKVSDWRSVARGVSRVASANPAAVTLDLAEWRRVLSGRPFALPPANRRALAELERIVEERNLRVVIVNGPLAETVANDPDIATYQLGRDQQFRERFGRGAIRYLDWQGVYEDSQMESADHLVADAPQIYSSALAAELKRLLAR